MPQSLPDALQALLGPAFVLQRELGGGGMSRVFVAHEPALKRDVVVKVLPHDLFSSRSAERFQREVEVTARLQHPHILPVVTAGGSERLRYYVVPYIAGGSLRASLDGGGPPSFDRAVTLLRELLSAVAFAHERGIVHRDIKPANVLLAEGHAVLADFGIAQAVAAAQAEEGVADSSVAPPEAYLAPERPTDTSADLYAVAALACEMFIGRVPSAGTAAGELLADLRRAHANADPQRLRAVAEMLARALSVDPVQRFRSAQLFQLALPTTGVPLRRSTYAAIAGAGALAATAVFLLLAFAPAPEVASVAPQPVLAESVTATGDSSPFVPPIAAEPVRSDEVAAPSRPTAVVRLDEALASAWRWTPADQERSVSAALAALELRDSLSATQSAIATGLVALGRRQFVAACDAFDAARATEPTYAAWMGAAECRARDSAVVAVDGGLRFRSDLYTAAVAYREAGRVGGSQASIALGRLPNVLFTESSRIRRGFDESGRVMLGQAMAVGDSIGFEVFAPGPRRVTPESMASSARAVALARDLLLPALVDWIANEPNSVRARETLIELLESTGHVRDASTNGLRALDEIRVVRQLPAEENARLRLARTHVRLLLRADAFSDAARLADSVLAAHSNPTDEQADVLLSLAMLTGKVAKATQLLEQVSGRPGRPLQLGEGRVLELPPSANRARAEFTVAGSLGACSESVRAGPARLKAVVDAMFPTGERPRGAEGAFLERPMMLSLPCLGPESFRELRDPAHPVARALQAPDGGVARAVGVLEAMRRSRQGPSGPGFDPTELAMTEAHLFLLHGDTSAAVAALERPLYALPLAPSVFLHSELLAATLPRVMALRAEIAMARGEREIAQRWAAAAVALWANADAELQPTVRRLSAALAGGP